MSFLTKNIGIIKTKDEKHGINLFTSSIIEFIESSDDFFNYNFIYLDFDELNEQFAIDVAEYQCFFINLSPSLFSGDRIKLLSHIKKLNDLGVLRKSVVTLHDVYYKSVKEELNVIFSTKKIMGVSFYFFLFLIKKIKHFIIDSPYNSSLKCIILNSKYVVLNSDSEYRRVLNFINDKVKGANKESVILVPHYIKQRENASDGMVKNSKLNLLQKFGISPNKKIITILGFIHKRKNQNICTDLLKSLGNEYQVVLAGEANRENKEYLKKILAKAKELKVSDNLIVTGFLDDKEYADILYATDVALAPYNGISASGTIADWLSVKSLVICSENAMTAEYKKHFSELVYFYDDKRALDSIVGLIKGTCSERIVIDSNKFKKYSINSACEKYAHLWECVSEK